MPLPSEMLRRMLAGDRDSARELGRWLDTLQGTRGGPDALIGAISGRVLVDSLIYGHMHADDVAQTIVVAAAGVYYEVPGSLTGGLCNGLTFQNSKELRVEVAGRYLLGWSMSLAAGNNDHLEGTAMINSTAVVGAENAAHTPGPGDQVGLAGSAVVALTVGDVVKLCVENETDADDIVMSHANLTLVRVGA